MIIDLLAIYLVGLGLSVGFEIRSTGQKRIILGIMGWMVAASMLGFAKINATDMFMHIEGLKTAYIPLLMVIPFALYRYPREIWQTVKLDYKVLLITLLVMGICSWITPLRPSNTYNIQFNKVSKTTLVSPYQGAVVAVREPLVNYGAELIESYLKEFHQAGYGKTYQNLWGIGLVVLGWEIIRNGIRLKEHARASWRELIALAILLITVSLGLIRFTDGLGAILLFGSWWLAKEMARDKQVVILGIVLLGCLMIQRNATWLWMIPSLLLFHPKETLWGVGTMRLLNPWLVGGHK